MKRGFCLQKFLVVVCLGAVIFAQATNVFAYDRRGAPRHRRDSHRPQQQVVIVERVYSGHAREGYHDGKLFLPLFLGLVGLSVGAAAVYHCSR